MRGFYFLKFIKSACHRLNLVILTQIVSRFAA